MGMRAWVVAVLGGIVVAIGLFYIVGDDRETASHVAKNAGTIGTTVGLLAFALSRFISRSPDSTVSATESSERKPVLDSRLRIAAASFAAGALVSGTAVVGFQRAHASTDADVYRQWLAETREPPAAVAKAAKAAQPVKKSATALLEEWRDSHQGDAPSASNAAVEFLPPTASEAFELRSKCAELGQRLLDAAVSQAFTRWQRLRYDHLTNRCYVKLFFHSAYYDRAELYDGQSRELIAWTQQEPGIVLGGSIEGEKHDSYAQALATMEKYMRDER